MSTEDEVSAAIQTATKAGYFADVWDRDGGWPLAVELGNRLIAGSGWLLHRDEVHAHSGHTDGAVVIAGWFLFLEPDRGA